MKKILTFIILGILAIATAIGAYLYNQNEIEIPDETVNNRYQGPIPAGSERVRILDWNPSKLSHPNIRIENNESSSKPPTNLPMPNTPSTYRHKRPLAVMWMTATVNCICGALI